MAQSPNLRRLSITIETPTETKGSDGSLTVTWSTYAVRRAELIPVAGREFFLSQQVYSEQTARLRLRADEKTRAITTKMRLVHSGSVYDIISATVDPMKNTWVNIIARLPNG